MRNTIIASVACVGVTIFTLTGSGIRTTAAQAPSTAQDVDPKIVAFIKPLEIGESDTPLHKKLKERHNAAVRLLEERVSEYKRGLRDISFVFDAARLTADSKLDLAETVETRFVVLNQVLEITKLIESHLQQQLANGFGSKGDLERARFGRLTVEVEILKLQKGAEEPKKQ